MNEKKINKVLASFSDEEKMILFHHAFMFRKAASKKDHSLPLTHWLAKVLNNPKICIKTKLDEFPYKIVRGVVSGLSSKRGWFFLDSEEQAFSLKSEFFKFQKSDLAVGDQALFSLRNEEEYWLESILPRRTCLARRDPHKNTLKRSIAANVDAVAIMATVAQPRLDKGTIDRFLVAAQLSGAESIILIINKMDLLLEEEKLKLIKELLIYKNLDLDLFFCSLQTGEGMQELVKSLQKKTVVLLGSSGVGKSSLLNFLSPEINSKVGTNLKSGYGRHTTTSAQLYLLPNQTQLIDIPGIREFAYLEVKKRDLQKYFAEFKEFFGSCKYDDCLHLHEKDCTIRENLQHSIPMSRYLSYKKILQEILEN